MLLVIRANRNKRSENEYRESRIRIKMHIIIIMGSIRNRGVCECRNAQFAIKTHSISLKHRDREVEREGMSERISRNKCILNIRTRRRRAKFVVRKTAANASNRQKIIWFCLYFLKPTASSCLIRGDWLTISGINFRSFNYYLFIHSFHGIANIACTYRTIGRARDSKPFEIQIHRFVVQTFR